MQEDLSVPARRPGSRAVRPVFAPARPVLARRVDAATIRHRLRAGEIERLRRGAYTEALEAGSAQQLAQERARVAIAAIHAQLSTDHVFVRESSALVWGLTLWPAPTSTHIAQGHRPGSRRGETASLVRHHLAVPLADRAVVDGMPVTSLERTAVDCACVLPAPAALAVVDSALRLGADTEALRGVLVARAGSRGVCGARRVVEAADGRSESAGESLLRWILVENGLAPDAVQPAVRTRLGTFYPDLGWQDLMVCAEFDGFVKYAGSGSAPEVVFAEKRRQDALEDAGWIVLRFTWADLRDPAAVVRRVTEALRRARHRAGR